MAVTRASEVGLSVRGWALTGLVLAGPQLWPGASLKHTHVGANLPYFSFPEVLWGPLSNGTRASASRRRSVDLNASRFVWRFALLWL